MIKAFAWMAGTLVSYTIVAVATRQVSFEHDTPTILFFRSLVAIALTTLIVVSSSRGLAQVQTHKIGTHAIRNCVHFVGQFGWFFAIATIPLAHVFALEFTVPIWVALFGPLVLQEKLTLDKVAYILIGFAGVLMIVQPFDFEVELGAVAMLIGAMGFAGAMLGTRKLTRTESPLCILFYMAWLQLPISTVLVLSSGSLSWPSVENLLLIVVITAGVMTAHYCMARAFMLAEVITVAPMEFLRLPMIAVIGAWLYGESIELATVAGSAAILLGNYLNLRASAKSLRIAK